MIRISRDHPIRLQTGRQYPRELLRGAFREMRAACGAQPDVPRLGDVAVDAGEPLFTLALHTLAQGKRSLCHARVPGCVTISYPSESDPSCLQ